MNKNPLKKKHKIMCMILFHLWDLTSHLNWNLTELPYSIKTKVN